MKSNSRANTRWLGALVAVIGGAAIVPFSDWASQALAPTIPHFVYLALTPVLAVLIAAISAWLLRTWWSAFIVPGSILVGYAIGAIVQAAVRGSLYTLDYALQYLALGLSIFALVYLLPTVLGAALGTVFATRSTRTTAMGH